VGFRAWSSAAVFFFSTHQSWQSAAPEQASEITGNRFDYVANIVIDAESQRHVPKNLADSYIPTHRRLCPLLYTPGGNFWAHLRPLEIKFARRFTYEKAGENTWDKMGIFVRHSV
jgi:hypothetical protein